MSEQYSEHRRQANATDERRPSLCRLLWQAVGQELGKVLRERLGETRHGSCSEGHTRHFQVDRGRKPLVNPQFLLASRPPEPSCRLDTSSADDNSHRLCRCSRWIETEHLCLWPQPPLTPSPPRPEVCAHDGRSWDDRYLTTPGSVQAEVRLPDSSISHRGWPLSCLP